MKIDDRDRLTRQGLGADDSAAAFLVTLDGLLDDVILAAHGVNRGQRREGEQRSNEPAGSTWEPSSRFHEGNGLESAPENLGGIGVQPVFEDAGVDLAEIRLECEVAQAVELPEVRGTAVKAGPDLAAEHEHQSGCTVIGAGVPVLGDASAEFGERHAQHPIELALPRQVLPKKGDRLAELLEQVRLLLGLRRGCRSRRARRSRRASRRP